MTTLEAVRTPTPFGRLFETDYPEVSAEVNRVEGDLPEGLRGTYYVNGPACFGRGGRRYRHWLDGDGMVSALTLDSTPRVTSRYVRTRKRVAEEEAGELLFRTFGTNFPGDRLRRGVATESPANVSVYPFAGRLLAAGEQGLPYTLDPVTLETLGVETFGGSLNEITPFSAHAKLDGNTGELVNFGVSYSAREPRLHYFRFDSSAGLAVRSNVTLDAPYSVHDFAISGRYAAVHLSPYFLNVERVLREGTATIDALEWMPGLGSRLLILSHEDGRELARVKVGRGYSLHTIRAFELHDHLFVDLIEYERPLYPSYQPLARLYENVPPGRPVRYVLETGSWRVVGRHPLTYAGAPDFPAVNAADPTGDVWVLGMSAAAESGPKFFDRLARVGWDGSTAFEEYEPPDGRYLAGEPVVVPDLSHGGAWVLCREIDPLTLASWFIVLEAYNLGRGPRARLSVEQPLPPGFHCSFCPSAGEAPTSFSSASLNAQARPIGGEKPSPP